MFRFAALQSEAASSALQAAGVPATAELPDSILMIDRDGVHARSEAAIRIASRLGFPWRLAGAARILPRPLRDRLYDFIARRRYRWFGRRDACRVPDPAQRHRFVE